MTKRRIVTLNEIERDLKAIRRQRQKLLELDTSDDLKEYRAALSGLNLCDLLEATGCTIYVTDDDFRLSFEAG